MISSGLHKKLETSILIIVFPSNKFFRLFFHFFWLDKFWPIPYTFFRLFSIFVRLDLFRYIPYRFNDRRMNLSMTENVCVYASVF